MIAFLAIVGFVVVVRQLFVYVWRCQELKSENEYLRQYWKDALKDKQQT